MIEFDRSSVLGDETNGGGCFLKKHVGESMGGGIQGLTNGLVILKDCFKIFCRGHKKAIKISQQSFLNEAFNVCCSDKSFTKKKFKFKKIIQVKVFAMTYDLVQTVASIFKMTKVITN